jgi:hypothetical protein
VFAARVKNGQNHQVRVREEPLFGFRSCGLGCARKSSQVAVSREASEMVQADPGQVRDFFFREEFLARLDSDHFVLLTFSEMLKAE